LELVDIEDVMYGEPYDVVVKITNLFKRTKSLLITLQTKSCYYTGAKFGGMDGIIKQQSFKEMVNAGQSM